MLPKIPWQGHRKETGTLKKERKLRKPAAGMATGRVKVSGENRLRRFRQAVIALMR
jgi:hypothetical protein